MEGVGGAPDTVGAPGSSHSSRMGTPRLLFCCYLSQITLYFMTLVIKRDLNNETM